MKFNTYTWNLYKHSLEGQKAIKEFEDWKNFIIQTGIILKCNPIMGKLMGYELISDLLEDFSYYKVLEYEELELNSPQQAKDLYEEIISTGLSVEGKTIFKIGDFASILNCIPELSFGLYYQFKDFFFPMLFMFRFFDLNKIADAFEIDLPTIPKKSNYKARCMYYWELCETFYKFRIENKLSPADLCAFLYYFASNFTNKDKAEIPQSSQAWFIGGKTSDVEAELDFIFWQSNPETKKGDILVHYETSPISAITCFWIAQTDGVIDPFFQYYSNTYISGRINIPHITLKELQADEYFSKHPLIRKKFQGVNGWSMSSEDYTELLRMIKAKGFDIDTLPKLYAPVLSKNISIFHERDVEIQLLEPLLNSMDWYENKNFIRQIPIHAGRGHRIFPDYALHYDNKPDYERAKVLIEAKLYMKNNQEIEEAFLQARSYAYLLESSVIILCDKICLIVYEKKDSFDRNNYRKYYWAELENPDVFNELKNKLNI